LIWTHAREFNEKLDQRKQLSVQHQQQKLNRCRFLPIKIRTMFKSPQQDGSCFASIPGQINPDIAATNLIRDNTSP
jgi:hypothetical protein